jgi:hypothetical protein
MPWIQEHNAVPATICRRERLARPQWKGRSGQRRGWAARHGWRVRGDDERWRCGAVADDARVLVAVAECARPDQREYDRARQDPCAENVLYVRTITSLPV